MGRMSSKWGAFMGKNNNIACLLVSVSLLVSMAGKIQAQSKTAQPVRSSFKEVTSKLDVGGTFYFYINPQKWADKIESQIQILKEFVSNPMTDSGADPD